jgi:hypothetical protein
MPADFDVTDGANCLGHALLGSYVLDEVKLCQAIRFVSITRFQPRDGLNDVLHCHRDRAAFPVKRQGYERWSSQFTSLGVTICIKVCILRARSNYSDTICHITSHHIQWVKCGDPNIYHVTLRVIDGIVTISFGVYLVL